MRNKILKRKKTHSLIFQKTWYYLILAIFILLINKSFGFWNSLRLPSIKLSNPILSRVYLPPPIALSNLSVNILGAQPIQPSDIVKYVNLEREKKDSPALIINDKLMRAAKLRAEVILKYQNFSHQDPYENIELATVLPMVGYNFSYASENMGMGGVSAEDFVGGFMNSYSHRENLLNPDLAQTGVAIVTGPYRQYYVNIAVQLFAIPTTEDEYLGYNEIDKKNYRNQLTKLELQLNPSYIYIDKLINKKETSANKLKNRRRQREILEKLYQRMIDEVPFEDEHISLIHEYNTYL